MGCHNNPWLERGVTLAFKYSQIQNCFRFSNAAALQFNSLTLLNKKTYTYNCGLYLQTLAHGQLMDFYVCIVVLLFFYSPTREFQLSGLVLWFVLVSKTWVKSSRFGEIFQAPFQISQIFFSIWRVKQQTLFKIYSFF